MEENTLEVKALFSILKRRKWDFVLTALGIFIIVAIITFVWPPTYRSSATILIEAQEIPKEYVMSTVTAFAEQRLQAINQRIMSYTTLLDIIKRFNLYADKRQKWTNEEIVDKMRKKDIKFETISAEVIDQRTGRPGSATIAFSVSFDGKSPDVVMQVANVLSSLYLEENLKSRQQQTAGASKFIEEEAKTIKANLNELDSKIAVFKRSNLDSLPELSQLNLQTMDRSDRETDQLKDQLRTLKEKEGYLQTQMASTPQDVSNPDRDRLKELRAKLVNFQTRYSEKHPDVIKTKQEIAELERRLGSSVKDKTLTGGPDNPAYVSLAAQLASTQSDIESTKRQIIDSQSKRDSYRKRIETAPRTEEQFKLLQIERNNLQLKYDDLMRKLMESRVAQGMEKGQMGERFTLIDPARLPEKPVFPNVPLVLLMGLILGIGAGVAVAALREFTDQSAHTVEDLARATNMTVFTGITRIVTRNDIESKRTRIKRIIFTICSVFVIAILIFHFFIMDLDVLWAKINRRFL